jgi:ribosomal protein S18 acetylase RimI-like enzyme
MAQFVTSWWIACRQTKWTEESRPMNRPVAIRAYRPEDWAALWPMLHATIEPGDTYAFLPESSEAEIRSAWVDKPRATFVACSDDGTPLGTYYIKENQPGLGSHVANAGYVVAPAARGRGIAAAMCRHSLQAASDMGFRAMQFNLVVSTNEAAVHLWKRLGFVIVGRLPGAFQHRQLGDVDALVMYRSLIPR